MRMRFPTFLLLGLLVAGPALAAPPRYALVIHGGAGVIERGALSEREERLVRADLNRALDAGEAVLRQGGSALDAAVAAVEVLEDSPRFNAG
ncbi:MAG TPA: isoaspartyl peptidase/L-asparaginase, partial [Arenimonas sp.]|nr:isoaspartyl peptidase/L-asparaginase [Arenimonas sp.]